MLLKQIIEKYVMYRQLKSQLYLEVIKIKLSVIIKKNFNRNNFCFPSDFYWINKNIVKKKLPNITKRILLMILFYFIATLICISYYLLLPFRIIHEWCESWCYW